MDLTATTAAIASAITDVQAAAVVVLGLVVATLAIRAVIGMFRRG